MHVFPFEILYITVLDFRYRYRNYIRKPVDATSFFTAMVIDMADKQPITAQPNAMLTRPFFQDGHPQPLKISCTNNTITNNQANVIDPEKHMFLHAFYDALCNTVHASAAAGLMAMLPGCKN